VSIEPLEKLAFEIERDVRFATGLGDQELLIDLPAARVERPREGRVGDEEIVYGVPDLERIELMEQRLELTEQHTSLARAHAQRSVRLEAMLA